jgi:hypothetical protein
MDLRLRRFPESGFLVWFALVAGIVAWLVHLTFLAAIVPVVEDEGLWPFHVANAACLLLALVALGLSWLIYRGGSDDEGAGTTGARIRFLGAVGLLVNGINVLLIVAEGVYAYLITPGH